ncbi:dNTP triphosphohydrolase [Myroides odoratimimus]|uniref:DGTPase n=1 Tax=Myroides odoratimimus TaxID=76832 RepID=A0AAI8G4B8_9FLAO|nr:MULTISPECIES: dNTP triphosphohydrolase [Myroides]ALU26087.1 dGTPase [Myroides odoratimimus]APA92126.1 dGTPase [Myroides sp. ZB35]MCS7471836.1 dNTP triphosphohydrolase [Myroides odoratimimus]MDM1032964.1 dNTP triphosphohydrolase [Myroides odoratimimus]MDM1037258.1 dNTP triphosphohydrolase [Myroides odoratimimus]
MMKWEKLLSLKKYGDTFVRNRLDELETRIGFEVDYDRIIFSSPFRSLQDKTQVIPLSKTNFVHTRLTHSLEVSVVGRSLGRIVGSSLLNKYTYLAEEYGYTVNDFGAIVAAASLAHDIGNPPFGHSGERAIGDFFKRGLGAKYRDQVTDKEWQDLIDFEGNANGFAILTKSRPGMAGGLRISYATLGAFMKYPKESLPKKLTRDISDKKYGFFQEDKEAFIDVANELGLISKDDRTEAAYFRHPLAFLVEAADDICYTITDFEDGINLGWIPEEHALEFLIKIVQNSINPQTYAQLASKEDRVSYLRALAIGSLIQDVCRVFLENEDKILAGEYPYALTEKCSYIAQMKDILSVSINKVYQSREVIEKEIVGYKVINALLEAFTSAVNNVYYGEESQYDLLIMSLLPDKYRIENDSVYVRLMNICHFISMLTDGKALELYNMIKGNDR